MMRSILTSLYQLFFPIHRFVCISLLGGILLVATSHVQAQTASEALAQPLACLSPTMTALDEAQLHEAIACYNADTQDLTVQLLADINLLTQSVVINNTTGATLSIEGGNHTLDGNEARAVFDVQGGIVQLADLTISNGVLDNPGEIDCGGGMQIADIATVTIERTQFQDNRTDDSGGGICNNGTLTLREASFIGNIAGLFGGGIYNTGVLHIEKTLFQSNRTNGNMVVSSGAAIFNSHIMTVIDSLLTKNSSIGYGGAISEQHETTIINSTIHENSSIYHGGGIYAKGRLTVRNSTISNNRGTGIDASGNTEINNSTIHNHHRTYDPLSSTLLPGFGVLNRGGTMTVMNSIIANNIESGDCATSGTTTVRHTLVEDGGCSVQSGINGNLTGDPLLEALQIIDPAVALPLPIHTVGPASITIDAGNSATCEATDQIGSARPMGTACDMGAYEGEARPVCNSATADVATESDLIWQINCFNGGTIDKQLTFTNDILLVSGDLVAINNAAHMLTIEGNNYTLSGNDQYRTLTVQTGRVNVNMLTIANGMGSSADCGGTRCGGALFIAGDATVTLTRSTFMTHSADLGGAIYNLGSLLISGGDIQGSQASQNGGGIYNNGNLQLSNVAFDDNRADGNGGALYNLATLTADNTTFDGNTAAEWGGAFYNHLSNAVTITNATVRNNQGKNAGALFNSGQISLTGSMVYSNTAVISGGGVYNEGTLTLENGSIKTNHAGFDGGGSYNSGSLTVADTVFDANFAANDGAGLYNNGTLSVSNSTFDSNLSLNQGGGVYNSAPNTTLIDTVWHNNRAGNGGGLSNTGDTTITNGVIRNNTVTHGGGGIYNLGSITFAGGLIEANHADLDGGGIYNRGAFAVNQTTLYANSADNRGGGVFDLHQLNVINSTFSSNTAGTLGGGFYNGVHSSTFNHVTMSENGASSGGGLYTQVPVNMLNSIIANSTQGGDCESNGHGIFRHTLIEDGSCQALATSSNSNVIGDPQLAPLTARGGILIHVLQSGSVAVNVGDRTTCTPFDQLGTARNGATLCDLGAYETNTPLFDIYIPIVIR